MRKGYSKWNWEVLDKELVDSYSVDKYAVSKFSSKYNISKITIWKRLTELGVKKRLMSKENHGSWKSGKSISKNGYVTVCVGKGKHIREHILVMEEKIGRKLLFDEVVHHIDETFEGRSNNNLSNLQLVTRSEHNRHHRIGKGKGYFIYLSKTENRWVLKVNINGKQCYRGKFITEEKAENCYKKWYIR